MDGSAGMVSVPFGRPNSAGECPIEALEDQITELAAHLNAGTWRLLRLITEFDRRNWLGRAGPALLRPLAELALRH